MRKILFLIFGIILLAGCLGTPKTDEPVKNVVGQKNASPVQQVQTSSKQPEQKQISKTSLDNLNDAYSKGKINKNDYIFYSLEALYDQANLPTEYAGEPVKNYDIADEIMLAVENWNQLPQEYKEKIGKWIELPDVSQAQKAQLSAKGTLHLAGEETLEIEAMSGKAKIFGTLPPNANSADKNKLKSYMSMIKTAVEDSWPKFRDMLAVEPGQKIFIYVKQVPAGKLGTATIRTTITDPTERCRLEIDPAQTVSETKTKSVTAHELFHCFQYHIPLRKWGNQDEKWIREATATWSENKIYPSYNREYDFLPTFFMSRHEPLVMVNGDKQYSDYLFFLFLEQTGDEWSVIKPLLNSKDGTKQAILGIENYDNKFAEFAAWNWNKDPEKKYQDIPNFPSNEINGPALIKNTLYVPEQTELQYIENGGNAAYQVFEVPENTEIKKIKFSFNTYGTDKKQRRALVKIGNTWEEQYWTNIMDKTFCLNKPEEKVKEIVLILSDSDLNQPEINFRKYNLDTTGECPFEISGTTRITYTFNSQGSDGPASGGSKMSGTFTSNDILWYDEEYKEYRIKSRTITCTYDELTEMRDEIYHIRNTKTGSGTATEEYNSTEEAPLKIRFDYEDNEIDFVAYPDYQNPKWVTYSMTALTEMAGAGGSTQSFSEKDSCTFVSAMNYLTELNMSEFDGHRIHGTRTLTTAAANSVVEYDYTLVK